MEFPQAILDTARKANARHPNDVQGAVDWAVKSGQRLKNFDEYVDRLVRRGWQEVICDLRHSITRQIKQDAGEYGGPAKVVSGASASVARACESAYSIYIAGMTLGDVVVGDMPDIGQNERAIADGRLFNARLCDRIYALVPASKRDQRVRDVVSEKRLWAILKELSDAE